MSEVGWEGGVAPVWQNTFLEAESAGKKVVPVRQKRGYWAAAASSLYGRKGQRTEDGVRLRDGRWRSCRYGRIQAN